MAAITLTDGVELNDNDLTEMVSVFKKCLPAYAIPVFLRVQAKVETTGTFKYQKNKLKEDAFDPSKTDERLLVLLPGATSYCDVNAEIFENIQGFLAVRGKPDIKTQLGKF